MHNQLPWLGNYMALTCSSSLIHELYCISKETFCFSFALWLPKLCLRAGGFLEVLWEAAGSDLSPSVKTASSPGVLLAPKPVSSLVTWEHGPRSFTLIRAPAASPHSRYVAAEEVGWRGEPRPATLFFLPLLIVPHFPTATSSGEKVWYWEKRKPILPGLDPQLFLQAPLLTAAFPLLTPADQPLQQPEL